MNMDHTMMLLQKKTKQTNNIIDISNKIELLSDIFEKKENKKVSSMD
jgi:hypothetical protein